MSHKYFVNHVPFDQRKENTNKKNSFYLERMQKVNVHFTLNSIQIINMVHPLYGITFGDKHVLYYIICEFECVTTYGDLLN